MIEKGDVMILSYKKLWKLLIDKELSNNLVNFLNDNKQLIKESKDSKKELANLAGLSQYTINKLNRSETVTTETLLKICYALKCDIGDICHVIFEEE